MTRVTELTPLLKRLQLGPMAATLPERIALARRDQLDYASLLEIILSDEVNRRADRRMELRVRAAGFEETCRLEDFDWSAAIILDRRLLDAVVTLQARTRPAGGPRRCRQDLLGPGFGLLGNPRRTHRPLLPCRRLLQGHDPGQSRQFP